MRPLAVLLGLSLFTAAPGVFARQADAEDLRRLNDRVNSHDEALDTFRTTIQELRSEIIRLRAENDRLKTQVSAPKNYATQEQFTKLVEQLREVEKNRATDKQQILDALDKIKSMPPVVVPPPDRPKPSGGSTGGAKPSGVAKEPAAGASTGGAAAESAKPAAEEVFAEYFEHTVGEGETLSAILDAYNKQHKLKTRLTHVLKANPAIKDPKRLRLGQKIRIPAVR